MEMSDMDGLALAQTIKADPAIAAVRLVLLTSLGKRGDAAAARGAGFAAYMTKPIRKGQLRDCLAALMGGNPVEPGELAPTLVTVHSLRETARQASAL